MRKRSLALAGSLVLTCALAGCTGNGVDPEARPSPTQSATTSPEPVELRLAVYGDDDTVAIYQRIADAFTASHPNVSFEVTSTTDGAAAAEAALGAIHTGVRPPDVFLLDVDQLPDVVDAEAVQPVNELLQARDIPFGDGIQRTGLTAFSANDQLACMPNDVSPLVAYYNKRLVKPRKLVLEDGTPVAPIREQWDWEAFRLAAEQAVSRGADQGAKGGYLPPDLAQLTPFILSGGGSIVDDNLEPTRLTLSDEATRDTLMALAAFTRDPTVSLTPAQVEQQTPLEWFTSGQLGVFIGTRADLPALRAAENLKFDVVPLPSLGSTESASLMNAYCIASTSDNAEAAADFIAFAVDGPGAAISAASGAIVPTSIDTLHSPEFLQPGQQPSNVQAYTEGARRSAPTPYSSHWRAARSSAEPALERILYGRAIDVSGVDTAALDQLLSTVDTESELIFNPPEPSQTPTP